jgi:hypothetical protein
VSVRARTGDTCGIFPSSGNFRRRVAALDKFHPAKNCRFSSFENYRFQEKRLHSTPDFFEIFNLLQPSRLLRPFLVNKLSTFSKLAAKKRGLSIISFLNSKKKAQKPVLSPLCCCCYSLFCSWCGGGINSIIYLFTKSCTFHSLKLFYCE